MRFLTYWSASVNMLRWMKLKILIRDSIRTFGKSFFLICKYFWWLIALNIGLNLYFHDGLSCPPQKTAEYSTLNAIMNIISHHGFIFNFIFFNICIWLCLFIFFPIVLMPFVCSLTTRSTVETKNFSYYLKYANRFWIYFMYMMSVITATLVLKYYTHINLNLIYLMLVPLLLSLDFGVFFFLDSKEQKIIASIKHGFLLIFYFFPLCVILYTPIIVNYLLTAFVNRQQFFITQLFFRQLTVVVLENLFYLILVLIYLASAATLYTKIRNKYPELF